MATTPIRAAIIDGCIWILHGILTIIDTILIFIDENAGTTTTDIKNTPHPTATKNKKPARIVIVGASFAGLGTYRDLIRHGHDRPDETEIIVIDYKDYFEYVPGILRCFVDPSHLASLTRPLGDVAVARNAVGGRARSRFVRGEVVEVDAAENFVTLDGGRRVPYDYLVLATGSTYPGPVKATAAESTLPRRSQQIHELARIVRDARTIGIVGGGAVGVELAGEIAERFPKNKRVVIIDRADTILPGFQKQTKDYCRRWLEDRGVELRLGTSIVSVDDRLVTFVDGTMLRADAVFKCVGASPACAFLKADGASGKNDDRLARTLIGPKGSIVVNDHLQVEGFDNIFCAGDACHHAASNELKLAHTAHVNASLVALNVLRSVRRGEDGDGRLLTYPRGLYGNSTTPKIYNVSLGKYDASLGFNSLVIHGAIPAIVKWLIEWTQVAAAANRPVGKVFWIVADWVSFFLGRTVLLPPVSTKSKDV